jgi:hypothetical protein
MLAKVKVNPGLLPGKRKFEDYPIHGFGYNGFPRKVAG